MSKYTTEVRYICEMKSGLPIEDIEKYTVDEIIEKARGDIFNFNYPIFDSSYKGTLETKILKHYYTREIAAETVGLWQLWLNSTMNEIMPKYNKLYQAERETVNKLFQNIDVNIDHLRTDDLLKSSSYTNINTHNDTDKRRYSDTPQGSISFADADTGNVWLTNYERSDNNGGATDRNTGTDANTGTQENNTHEYGYRGGKTYYEMLSDFNDKVLNIDMMIINDLQDLFFKLW